MEGNGYVDESGKPKKCYQNKINSYNNTLRNHLSIHESFTINIILQMILMMVLPLLLITVLPKMMNDPETKREMEQMHQSMNVQNQVNQILTLFVRKIPPIVGKVK